MSLCTKLQKQVLDLEEAKTAQAKEIASLKKRVKQLEKRRKSRTLGLKRLRKLVPLVGRNPLMDKMILIEEAIDEAQERNDEEMLFDVQDDLQVKEVVAEKEVARNLEAQLQAELEEEERLSRLKEEKASIALLESWDNTQAMMDADFQLAQQMQTEEQEQLSIKEKSKLFVELLEKRKKHFAALRAQEKRSKPPTKA
ncbi:hypothetical protein Tco_1291999 [Tanacetum coccineum]